MIELFLLLVFVHFVFDFCLQSEFMSKYKQQLTFVMFVHVFVWTAAIVFALKFLGFVVPLWLIAFLYVGHHFSDTLKCALINTSPYKNDPVPERDMKRTIRLFHIDQLWHLLQLLLVVFVI